LNLDMVIRPDRIRIVGAAAAVTLTSALLSPFNALACGTTTAGAAGGSSNGGSGGGQLFFGTTAFDTSTYLALGGFGLLMLGVMAIALVLTLRRPRPAPALMAQLSADGRYWWDGMSWHDSVLDTPPQPLRSADGAHWWDGGRWRPIPA
jgi:hypothetical protein